MIPPAVSGGPHLSIRRFSRESLSPARLVELGALTSDALETLRALLLAKQNVVVAGGTGSGKTSLLRALATLVPDDERIVVIEDTRELSLPREHVVELEARPPDARGRGGVSIRQLFQASLRLRPDRLVIGEIRGGEALDLVQAMTSGHGGCLTTVHATYPTDTLHRLETLALMGGVELPLAALRSQLASAVDVIVQTARLRDGTRRVTHVTEVTGLDPAGGYRLRDLFLTRPAAAGGASGPGAVALVPTGLLPDCTEVLHAHGLHLPRAVQRAGRIPSREPVPT